MFALVRAVVRLRSRWIRLADRLMRRFSHTKWRKQTELASEATECTFGFQGPLPSVQTRSRNGKKKQKFDYSPKGEL